MTPITQIEESLAARLSTVSQGLPTYWPPHPADPPGDQQHLLAELGAIQRRTSDIGLVRRSGRLDLLARYPSNQVDAAEAMAADIEEAFSPVGQTCELGGGASIDTSCARSAVIIGQWVEVPVVVTWSHWATR